jgi:hypothetical protein
LKRENIQHEKIPYKDINLGAKFFINVANRKIECVILYSTSTSAGANITEDGLFKQFKKHLG